MRPSTGCRGSSAHARVHSGDAERGRRRSRAIRSLREDAAAALIAGIRAPPPRLARRRAAVRPASRASPESVRAPCAHRCVPGGHCCTTRRATSSCFGIAHGPSPPRNAAGLSPRVRAGRHPRGQRDRDARRRRRPARHGRWSSACTGSSSEAPSGGRSRPSSSSREAGLLPIVLTNRDSHQPWIGRPELDGALIVPFSEPTVRSQTAGVEELLRAILRTFDVRGVVVHHNQWLYDRLHWIARSRPGLPDRRFHPHRRIPRRRLPAQQRARGRGRSRVTT